MDNPNPESSIARRVRNLNISDRTTRTAKKSTATVEAIPPAPKYSNLTRSRRQAALASKDKSKDIAKYLNSDSSSVDSEGTSRDKRRGKEKVAKRVPGAAFDSNGVHISGVDLCDCLQEECPGCHFPCPKCQSPKCGVECRVNRKYVYEMIEYHGYEFVIKNPLLKW